MQLWRIHIRPGGEVRDPDRSFAVCERQGVIGVGWAVDREDNETLSLEEYLRRAEIEYPKSFASCRSAVTALAALEQGDLVWARDGKGQYWLARVQDANWEYRDSDDNAAGDVVNVRPVELVCVGTDAHVPGKVVASFRAGRTLQRVQDETALTYSRHVFAELGDETPPRIDVRGDIFSLLSDQDTENVIFVMLQRQGWVVFPASRKADTMSYEFVLRHSTDGREAVTQVKTGNQPIDLAALPQSVEAFVFQPKRLFIGTPHAEVHKLDRVDVEAFMRKNQHILPPTVTRWMQIAGRMSG